MRFTSASPSPDSRAIVITEIIEMGGAERACLALARWLYEHNLPVHIVTYQDIVDMGKFASHPLQVVQLRPPMNARSKIRSLGAYFSARPNAPKPLMSGYQPALHATLAGMRGFHTLMHDTPSLFSDRAEHLSIKRRLARKLSDRITAHGLRSGGVTVVTSAYLKDETRRAFGVEAVIARMGGLPGTKISRPHSLVGNRLRMLSVSRIEGNKRIDWMLRSLASLERATPPLSASMDWTLDITGRGSYLEEARSLSRTLGLDQRVVFHGFVADETLQQLYDGADLFLMPAVQGYGIPAIESLARGIPVLLHRDSGVSDILLETPWATVFNGGEPNLPPALLQAITKLREGHHLNQPIPTVPTEDQWAEQVARLCRWT